MNTEDLTKKVIASLKEGEQVISEARRAPKAEKEDEEMAAKTSKQEGFDPGKYNKAWVAGLAIFGSQWGVNFNEAINQIVANPPENMLQALLFAIAGGAAVWYVKNRGE